MMKMSNLAETLSIALLIGVLLVALSSYQSGQTRHTDAHNDASSDTVIEQIDRSSNRIKVMAKADEQEASVSHVYF